MQPLLRGLLQEGITFRGLLYPGLIITRDGARRAGISIAVSGDPETQALVAPDEIRFAASVGSDD